MRLRHPVLILSSVLLVAPAASVADKDGKGYGAGGVRADHASEQGLEKGKAWAGSKEKKDKPAKEEKAKKEKKGKKEKKQKKDKKSRD